MRTPPVISGNYPIVGHTFAFAKDHLALFARGFKEKGSIFSFSLAGKSAVVLIGPEYHKAYFEATDNQLTIDKVYGFIQAITGKVFFLGSHETYLNQRPILYEPFKYRKSQQYVPIMQKAIQQAMDKLGDEGELELAEYCVELTRQVAGYSFMGEKFQAELGMDFFALYNDISASIDLLLPPHLPLPKFIKRDKAKAKMKEMLKPVIADRRANPDKYQDFMQEFINTPMVDGTYADDDTVLDFIITFMFASHDTTGGHTAWTIIQLLQNPSYLAALKAEIQTQFPTGFDLTLENIKSFKHAFWAVEETARMHPTADILMRFVEKDWEVNGYVIPKGWLAFVSAKIAHFLPEIYENPTVYDPYRYAKGREEDKTCPYQQIGFGGGAHKCAGMFFAKNEMVVILLHLFREFDLTLVTQNPHLVRTKGTPRPSDTIIRYKRKPVVETMPATFENEQQKSYAAAMGCPHAQALQKKESTTLS